MLPQFHRGLSSHRLVPLALSWSAANLPSPQDSTYSGFTLSRHPSDSVGLLPQAQPLSSVTPAPPRSSGSTPLPQSNEPSVPPRASRLALSPWLCVSLALSGSPHPLQELVYQASTMAPPSCDSTTGLLPGWVLGYNLAPPAPDSSHSLHCLCFSYVTFCSSPSPDPHTPPEPLPSLLIWTLYYFWCKDTPFQEGTKCHKKILL